MTRDLQKNQDEWTQKLYFFSVACIRLLDAAVYAAYFRPNNKTPEYSFRA
jgi:hypothetical protein